VVNETTRPRVDGALRAFSQGRPSPLPEFTIQYADYAAWQRDWLQGEVLEAQLATEEGIVRSELRWAAISIGVVSVIMLAIIYAGLVHHINPPSNIETIDRRRCI